MNQRGGEAGGSFTETLVLQSKSVLVDDTYDTVSCEMVSCRGSLVVKAQCVHSILLMQCVG